MKEYLFSEFMKLTEELVKLKNNDLQDKTEAIKLNFVRMKRIYGNTVVSEKLAQCLSNLKIPLKWVVISEPWCGDSAQILPILAKIAESTANIELKIVLRDENSEFMDNHLTNGTRSIPKLICYNQTNDKQVGEWGPRPKLIMDFVSDYKKTHPILDKKEFNYHLHHLYGKDNGKAIQEDTLIFLKSITETT